MKKILLLPFLAFAMLSCTAPKTQDPMQNEVINAIMSRRSIRQYHATPVPFSLAPTTKSASAAALRSAITRMRGAGQADAGTAKAHGTAL